MQADYSLLSTRLDDKQDPTAEIYPILKSKDLNQARIVLKVFFLLTNIYSSEGIMQISGVEGSPRVLPICEPGKLQ